MTAPDPELQKAIDQMNAQNELEDAMSEASECLEISEFLRGKTGEFVNGFWAGCTYERKHAIQNFKHRQEKWHKLCNEFPQYLPTEEKHER